MKKGTVTVSFEAEKLRAVEMYMEKKEANLREELEEQLQRLYERHVPANVREYIVEKDEGAKASKTRKTAKKVDNAVASSTKQE